MAQSQPASRPTAGVVASNKVEGRKLQMLVRQREQLEQELRELESEVLTLVGRFVLLQVLGALNTILTMNRRQSRSDDASGRNVAICIPRPMYQHLYSDDTDERSRPPDIPRRKSQRAIAFSTFISTLPR